MKKLSFIALALVLGASAAFASKALLPEGYYFPNTSTPYPNAVQECTGPQTQPVCADHYNSAGIRDSFLYSKPI